MTKIIMSALVAVMLSGCAAPGLGMFDNLDTPGKQGVAFCNTFRGVMQKMVMFRRTGNLSPGDIEAIGKAINIIGPYCISDTPDAPTASIIDALDIILIIQLSQRT